MSEVLLHPFEQLKPDLIMDAVESQGLICDGRIFPLNSYENRVYQVGIEDQSPIIAKFYRPARWSDEQIAEEHEFCFELTEQELPVVAPNKNADGKSLFEYNDFRFSLFIRRGGHAPELDNADNLIILGRLLGRIHLIGSTKTFKHRPKIDSTSFGHDSFAYISKNMIPMELQTAYDTLAKDVLAKIDSIIKSVGEVTYIRTHGDCHVGNMLWRDDAPHFVDFDDSRMAPAIQDLWMLLSGDRAQQTTQMMDVLEGYNEFADFPLQELQLIECMRTLRIMHYSAWLSRRWGDPAFPHSFPWFNTMRYWENHILELREQFALLDEPPLKVMP